MLCLGFLGFHCEGGIFHGSLGIHKVCQVEECLAMEKRRGASCSCLTVTFSNIGPAGPTTNKKSKKQLQDVNCKK